MKVVRHASVTTSKTVSVLPPLHFMGPITPSTTLWHQLGLRNTWGRLHCNPSVQKPDFQTCWRAIDPAIVSAAICAAAAAAAAAKPAGSRGSERKGEAAAIAVRRGSSSSSCCWEACYSAVQQRWEWRVSLV